MNTSEPSYAGVNVTHPSIVNAIKNCAKRGMSKEQAMKIIGMPMVVIEKHYKTEGK